MSIGIYDQDFVNYVQVPFNLDAMKLAAYYKRKNEIVILCTRFSPEKHSTIYLRKDYRDGIYIVNPSLYSNVITGGLAYSNGIYLPMATDIESTVPDTHIYDKYRRFFAKTVALGHAFDVMTRAEHIRLSLDGKTIWPGFAKQIHSLSQARCLFIHDPQINDIEGAFDLIKKLTDKMNQSAAGRRIGVKFPVLMKNEDDLLRWTQLWPSAEFYTLQFNGLIDDEAFVDFIRASHKKSVSDQLIYRVDIGSSDQNDFVKNKLCQIYKQIIFSRMNKRRLVLKYDDNFFVDKRWERLLRFFQCYHNTFIHYDETHAHTNTLYHFARSIQEESNLPKDIFLKDEVRELFAFVREQNYELFDLFYHCSKVSLKGGKLENDTTGN